MTLICPLCKKQEGLIAELREKLAKATAALSGRTISCVCGGQKQIDDLREIAEKIIHWAPECYCLTDEEASAAGGRTCPTCLAKEILDASIITASKEGDNAE